MSAELDRTATSAENTCGVMVSLIIPTGFSDESFPNDYTGVDVMGMPPVKTSISVVFTMDDSDYVAAFARLLHDRAIAEAELVIGARLGDGLHIWNVFDEAPISVRYQVYEAEQALYERYPEQNIQYRLIRRRGEPLEHCLPTLKSLIVINMRSFDAYQRTASTAGQT